MLGKLRRSHRTGLISPLIDVVLGAFLALFVLFSAFVILTRGGYTEPLRFLEGVELPDAIEGQSYVFTLPVTGGAGNRHFDLAGDLPADLAFETASGTVFGFVQPSAERRERGVSLTAVVQDATGRDEREARLRVFPGAVPYDPDQAGLRLVPPEGPLPPGRVGRAYSVTFGALGGVEPYVWSARGFPSGVGLENGVLLGVPGESGSFTCTVRVEHSPGTFHYRGQTHPWAGGSVRGEFTLRVLETLQVAERFPAGRVGEPYLASLLTGGLLADERVEWEDLPPGIEVSGGGLLLAGVPTSAGTFSPVYRVHAQGEELAAGRGDIVILPPVEPGLGPVVLQAWLGEPTRHLLPVRGLIGPLDFAVEGDLPPGFEIRDGYLIGTPEEAGLTVLQITAIGGAGNSVTGEVAIRVGPRF